MTPKSPSGGTRPGLYGATALMAGGTFLSRVLGLVREQVFAYLFGAGPVSDAFQMAFRIPNILRDLLAEGAMSSALVPIYTKLRHEKGDEAAWSLVSNITTALLIALCALSLMGILGSSYLIELFAPAFHTTTGKFELTVELTRILWIFLPLAGMAAVWMGILHARSVFGVPALAPSSFNVISILAGFTICPLAAKAFGLNPIYGWAIGALLGGAANWFVQIPSLRWEGFRYRFHLDLRDPALRHVVSLMGAGTFGLAATQINVLVNSVLASSQGDGAVSWLYFAFRLLQFPIGIFGVSISTANFTLTSQAAARGDFQGIRDSLRDALRMTLVLAIPSSFGLAVLGIPIISVIYQHGQFQAHDTYQTSLALSGYAFGLLAFAGNRVMVPVLYSLGKARAAVWSSALGMIFNVSLSLILVKQGGFAGLAYAMSSAAILHNLVLLWILDKSLKQIEFNNLAICTAKTLSASLFMAIIVYVFLWYFGAEPFHPIPLTGLWDKANFATHVLILLASLVLGVGSFSVAGKLLGLHELERAGKLLWKRQKIRKGMP